MANSEAVVMDVQKLTVKLAPSLLIVLLTYHFFSTKASTLLYLLALLFLLIVQFRELSPQMVRNSMGNNFKVLLGIVALCSIIAIHGQFLFALKILVITMSSVLFLELVTRDKEILFDRPSIILYFSLFISVMALVVIQLKFTLYIYDLLSFRVRPSFYNGLTLLLSIMIPTIVQGASPKFKSVILLSLILWVYFIMISECESAQVVLLFSPLIMLMRFGMAKVLKYVVSGSILAMPLIVNLAYWLTEYFQVVQQKFWGSYTVIVLMDRIVIWHSYYAEYGGTLFGVGPKILKRLYNPNVLDLAGGVMVSHPHNALLQVHVELGIVGAILVAGLVFMLFKKAENFDPKYKNAAIVCISLCVVSRVSTYSLWSTHAYALMFTGMYMSRLFIEYINRPVHIQPIE